MTQIENRSLNVVSLRRRLSTVNLPCSITAAMAWLAVMLAFQFPVQAFGSHQRPEPYIF
jgi:hypothetical protein